MTAHVSVLLPAYNAESTIGAAIASMRAQTFTDWELLVVDDGSTDGTLNIAEAIAHDDVRVRVLARPHEGLVAALNAGIAVTQGELVARMDADDESHPDRLHAQRELLAARSDVGLASCLVDFGGNVAVSEGYARHVEWVNSLITPDEIALNRFIESPLAHPTVMFRRTLLDQFGGYRSGDFPEDYELWLRWFDAGVRAAKVPRILLRWTDAPQRASRVDPRYDPEAFFRMKAKWIARELERRQAVATGPATEQRSEILPRPVWIWGAGRPTRRRAAFLCEHGVAITGHIDVDPRKFGRSIRGTPVIPPTELPPPREAFVLGYVGSRGARELIRAELTARGYREGADFLMCA